MANSENAMISTDEDMFVMEEDVDHHHLHSLSRLSMCTTTTNDGGEEFANYYHTDEEENDDDDDTNNGGGAMAMYMSRLSIESFDGDADEEFSNDGKEGKHMLGGGLSSDSDKELPADCYSLPGTPKKNRLLTAGIFKEYASENEIQKGDHLRKKMTRRARRRMVTMERWGERANWDHEEDDDDDTNIPMQSSTAAANNFYSSFSGESDQGAGLLVITRPKGGRRSLCMDMEEVKACNDLGFELEHERMLEMRMPSAISLDNSSGGDSPLASWRISSPGDDPRDVKARLKVWAQAVALASTSSSRYIG